MCPLDCHIGLDQIAAALGLGVTEAAEGSREWKSPWKRRAAAGSSGCLTVLSAAILIGAEVFGAAFAGGWALAGLFHLGETGGYVLQSIFFVIGLFIMASFIRAARRVEPFTG